MKRYFIVFYSIRAKNGASGDGNASVTTLDGRYVDRKNTTEAVATNAGFSQSEIALTNVIELDESDHLDWNS